MADHRKMTDEQRELAAAHVHLARGAADKLGRRWPALADDLYSAALVGLCDAAVKFRPEDGHQFATYAPQRIVGAILDYMRVEGGLGMGNARMMKRRNDAPVVMLASTPLPCAANDNRPETLADVIPSGELPVGWEIESEDAVRVLTRALGKAGAAVRLYLLRADLEGRMRDVAEELELSESRASQLVADALAQLGASAPGALTNRRRPRQRRFAQAAGF
jgi:RNA polymerase sigma factor (sigma-70 family)